MIVLYAAATVFFVPGLILTLAGGFIFGWWGLPIISAGSVLGATLAFLNGRFLARSLVKNAVQKYPIFNSIDRAVEEEGWKIIFLLRLISLIPFNFLNYALGLTSASTIQYILASWIGMLPGTALYVYFGKAAGSLASILSGDTNANDIGVKVGFLALSGVVILIVFVVVILIGKRAMSKYFYNEEVEGWGELVYQYRDLPEDRG
eukprot:CAMPEP_0117418524 /NCGR_PEP_ID=MMETSP0758-20121206/276_1 /TAXON_ID=63605 /ORGANISM="Percolomonas cosmopolitus, Strain AE-1 (ATCC 50343)" /LENGTH=204 /DNA_ID=CAMNT_0005199055 /DNA_START=576 /DNA_END=1186 /DNA_ORIENTATION=+